MKIEVLWTLLLAVSSTLLFLIFVGLLVAILQGLKRRKVIIMTVLLLITNLFMLVYLASEIYAGYAIVRH